MSGSGQVLVALFELGYISIKSLKCQYHITTFTPVVGSGNKGYLPLVVWYFGISSCQAGPPPSDRRGGASAEFILLGSLRLGEADEPEPPVAARGADQRQPEEREVQVGVRDNLNVQIVKGLKAGEQVLLQDGPSPDDSSGEAS